MKKYVTIAFLISCISSVIAMETNDYKQELLDRGWLYGCAPANWSLVEPVRGAFNYAALKGELEIMDLEVKAGLDITTCSAALPIAIIDKKQNEALDFLFKNGYNPNNVYFGYSYLYYAVYKKNVNAVQILINNGADVNQAVKDKIALNLAIKKKQPEIVKILLNAGAKPDEKTHKLVKKTKNEEIKALFNND